MRGRQLEAQLHVNRQQISRAEQRNAVDESHDAAHRKWHRFKQCQVHQRRAPGRSEVALPRNEADKRASGTHQQHGRLQAVAAVQLDHAVEQAQRPRGAQQQPAPVERRALPVGGQTAGCRARHIAQSHPDRHQAQRHHHEENRAPAKQIDQHAAHAGAQRRRQHHAHAKEAAGTALLVRPKRPHDDDGRNRLHNAGGQALGHARAQHQAEAVGEAADHAARH